MNVFLHLQTPQNKHLRKCVFLLLCLAAAAASGQAGEADIIKLLEPAPSFEKSPAFKVLLNREPNSSGYEIKRIEYLLERITRSSSIFIRNGENYPGTTAVLLMRWKYARYQKEIKTAEHFAEKIANGSRTTGQDYKIRFQDGSISGVTKVLLNELARLDEALAGARAALISEENTKPDSPDTGTEH